MISQRNMGGGSPYPTGRSPMVLDIEKNIHAVTQQLVQNRKQEISEKKLAIEDSEKIMLDALDFEPIQGLSDQIAVDHAKRIEDMSDKWTRVWRDREGVLSSKDKLDLAKEQREVQRKLDFAAADIAFLKEIKTDLAKREGYLYDKNKTAPALYQYMKEGKAGSGNAINIPVMAQQPYGAAWMARVEPLLKNAMSNNAFSKSVEGVDRSTGQVDYTRSNEAAVKDVVEFGMQFPEFKEMYDQDPQGAIQFAEGLMGSYSMNVGDPKFEAGARPRAESATAQNAALKNAPNDYGWSGLTEAQVASWEDFNVTAEGIRQGDPTSVQKMTTDKSVQGGVESVEYFKKGGKQYIRLNLNPVRSGTKSMKIPPVEKEIPAKGDAAAEKEFYSEIWKYYPKEFKQGIHTLPVAKYLVPEKMGSQEFGATMPDSNVQKLDESMSALDGSVNKLNISTAIAAAKEMATANGFKWKIESGKRNSVVVDDGTTKKTYDLGDPTGRADFISKVKGEAPALELQENEIVGKLKDGRFGIFDKDTKEFIRYAE